MPVIEVTKPHENSDRLIITYEQPRFFRKPKVTQYIGSGTVWHYYPSFQRCSSGIERWLTPIWSREQHRLETLKR